MAFEIEYFYFDYSLILKCTCGRISKQYGTNHINKFECPCGLKYKMEPEVVKIK